MLSASRRDPAMVPRVLIGLLAIAVLWPGIQLSELNPVVLLQAENREQMARFTGAFWPPAHERDFLELLLEATLQTLAVATAGMVLAWLLAVPAALLASRALSLSAASRGGRPGVWSRPIQSKKPFSTCRLPAASSKPNRKTTRAPSRPPARPACSSDVCRAF